jgi:hypothetical protein
MPFHGPQRESYLIRLWTEDDEEQPVLRGSIQNVQTGHKTFFDAIDLPVHLLRESARRLGDEEPRASVR